MISAEVMAQVRRIQIRTNRLANDLLAGEYESVFKGQGMEFREVRAYVPGDDVRLIDWNVTARTGHPQVKVLAEERELTVMLVVDASGSGRFGSGRRMKNELAAELCAVLAFSAIKNNDRVGLLIFTDQVELHVPPSKGRKHVLRVIREILYFEPKRQGTSLKHALDYLNRVQKRRAVCFLVSDFMDQGYERPLQATAKRHDLIAALISDPRESELPGVGLVAVRDAETGREVLVDTSDAEVRGAYRQAWEERQRTVDALLRRHRVDALHLSTGQPYADELHRFFRQREKRLR